MFFNWNKRNDINNNYDSTKKIATILTKHIASRISKYYLTRNMKWNLLLIDLKYERKIRKGYMRAGE